MPDVQRPKLDMSEHEMTLCSELAFELKLAPHQIIRLMTSVLTLRELLLQRFDQLAERHPHASPTLGAELRSLVIQIRAGDRS